MNSNMFAHPAVVENLRLLQSRGVRIVEPGSGYLACGWIGKGRLAEPQDVVAYVQQVLQPRTTTLDGRRVLVTAGPTYENIDPVRFIGNRASGRMGVALAAEALAPRGRRDAGDRPDLGRAAARGPRSCACAARLRCTRR